MSIRIGGNSADTGGSCGTPTGNQSVQAMNEFARATGTQFSFGVNLVSEDLPASKAQAAAYCAGMPSGSIANFEATSRMTIQLLDGAVVCIPTNCLNISPEFLRPSPGCYPPLWSTESQAWRC
jgi:hypothetical protein